MRLRIRPLWTRLLQRLSDHDEGDASNGLWLLPLADCECGEVICGLLGSVQDLWRPVELVAGPLDNVRRPNARVDVFEDGPLALLVARIYLLVGCANVLANLVHLLVLGVLPSSDEDCHSHLCLQTLSPELLAVLDPLHVVHGLLHDVAMLQVESLTELLDALDALRDVLLVVVDLLVVLLVELLRILTRPCNRG